MMIDQYPSWSVHAGFEMEIGHPGGFLPQLAQFPGVIMVRLERDLLVEQLFSQSLEKKSGDKAIKITLMGENDFRLWQSGDAVH